MENKFREIDNLDARIAFFRTRLNMKMGAKNETNATVIIQCWWSPNSKVVEAIIVGGAPTPKSLRRLGGGPGDRGASTTWIRF